MSIKCIEKFIETLKSIQKDKDNDYYYRGHSDDTFDLLPSIYRKISGTRRKPFIRNEDKIFREIILRTPADFEGERTTIEKLVKMQHYGLPTRLLDITSNPLVALYFACNESINENPGEVVVLRIPKEEVKFYDSDTVSILSNVSRRPYDFDISYIIDEFDLLEAKRPNSKSHITRFNSQEPIPYLLHEIKDEKPQFLSIIRPSDFNRVLAVKVKLNNNRISKQSGAFLLFGFNRKKARPANVPIEWIVKGFDLKIEKNDKGNLLNDLEAIGINPSTLFPELEHQAIYIRNFYLKGVQTYSIH
jgi:hypothetical protein